MRLLLLSLAVLAPFTLRAQDSTRVAAWREDLDSALTVFMARDKSFSPKARAEFMTRVRALRDSVPSLSDEQIITRLATATALAENAHTRLYLVRNRTAVRRLPVRVWWFGNELRVVRVQPGLEELLGAQVTAIGSQPIAAATRAVRPLYAGNDSWARYKSTYTLTSPELLKGLGIITTDTVTIELALRDGKHVTRALAPMPLRPTNQPTEAWWDLTPLHPGRDGPWTSVIAADSARLPLYLRNPTTYYWFEYLPASRALYVNYNRSSDQPEGERTGAWADRLFAEIAARNPEKLIIDLRYNTGGNLDLAESMFRRITELPLAKEKNRLFVITGRATFSAGLYPAGVLRQHTRAVIVGEAPGDVLDYWSEGGNIVLPHSKLTMHFADRFHSYSAKEYPERKPYVRDLALEHMRPDIRVEQTFAEYLALRDPALERILRMRR
jgi:hypothetical protein